MNTANQFSPWAGLKSSVENPDLSTLEKVKRLAGARGLSLKDVAAALGFNYVNFHKLIRGERPTRCRAVQTASFFGVAVGSLFPQYGDADALENPAAGEAEFFEGAEGPGRAA